MARCALLALALLIAAAAPARASGDVLPGASAGNAGITAPGLDGRFVALGARGGTLIMKVDRRGGRVALARFVNRRLIVSAVALDGSATGLPADGSSLVLAAPRRFGRRHSDFVVLDAQRLTTQRRIRLSGDLALDAVSPDGRTLYLVEATSRRDVTRFRLRAYDVEAGRLRARAIVDPDAPVDALRGAPVARALSTDGRWAYTLYEGPESRHPFILALDTVRGRAKRIDVDDLVADLPFPSVMRARRDGTLRVRDTDAGRAILIVDTRTWHARRPGPAAHVRPEPSRAGWAGPAAGLVVLALLGAAVIRMR
jgi:hypothetical protein